MVLSERNLFSLFGQKVDLSKRQSFHEAFCGTKKRKSIKVVSIEELESTFFSHRRVC